MRAVVLQYRRCLGKYGGTMTPIQIVEPQSAHAAALRQIYLSATSAVPHCRFAPDVERFAQCLTHSRLVPTRIFVAEEHGAPQGFAALVRVRSDGVEKEAISALFFAHPAAGQALLDACEAQASGNLQAFPAEHGRCPIVGYNAGWDGLSDRMPAVAQLLARNGYTPFYRELSLICDLAGGVAAPGAPPVGVDVRVSIGDEKQYILQALISEQEAGECHYVTLTHLGGADAARTGYVWWLNVQPEARRRGIGRYLILRTLEHMRSLGCHSCWLTTGAENWPAQPLYLALDFEIVDCTASYQKRMTR
jgi:ribosomal protein S18 acetylase RimI-like enzyme